MEYPEFNPPEDRVGDGGARHGHFEPEVSSLIAKELAHRPDKPHLRHANDRASRATETRHNAGDADWQARDRVVRCEVVSEGFSEEEVLLEKDNKEKGNPVPENREEVGEDLAQVLASPDSGSSCIG